MSKTFVRFKDFITEAYLGTGEVIGEVVREDGDDYIVSFVTHHDGGVYLYTKPVPKFSIIEEWVETLEETA